MSTQTLNPAILHLDRPKAWLMTAAFVVGNFLLPQLCHLLPDGGLMFLPIYLLTLIAAIACGWQVAFIVALLSPMLNSLVFSMPYADMLPPIIIKGFLLVCSVELMRKAFGGLTYLGVILAVLLYQLLGCGIEAILTGSLATGFADMLRGYPGILIQIVGGCLLLLAMSKVKGKK